MVTPYIRQQLSSGLVRLRVTPDEPTEGPPAITGQRPRSSRLPHTDMTVAKVRHLIEHTDLTHRQIEARTGASTCAISRWTRDFGWQRPPHAPRASDMVPDWRAGRRLKLRKLAGRLQTLAERYVRELEAARRVDVETLMQALQVLKMARLEAIGGHRRRSRGGVWIGPAVSGAWATERDNAIRKALKEMRRGGVDIDRAPKEAVEMLIEANTPLEDFGKLRLPRGGRRRSRNDVTS
jgi:transcriptional regulator with XRE-family HTH domain